LLDRGGLSFFSLHGLNLSLHHESFSISNLVLLDPVLVPLLNLIDNDLLSNLPGYSSFGLSFFF
jgi:hypothetical protein